MESLNLLRTTGRYKGSDNISDTSTMQCQTQQQDAFLSIEPAMYVHSKDINCQKLDLLMLKLCTNNHNHYNMASGGAPFRCVSMK